MLAAKPSKGGEELGKGAAGELRLAWTLRNTWLAFTLGLYGDAVSRPASNFLLQYSMRLSDSAKDRGERAHPRKVPRQHDLGSYYYCFIKL